MRVLIADDHALVRRGLRSLLTLAPDIEVVGEVGSADEVLGAVQSGSPDVLILDVSMPGLGFLQLLDQLRQQAPGLRTLVVSGHPEFLYARRALRAGAAGYVTKDQAESELVAAIRKVSGGNRYVSASLAQELAADVAGDSTKSPHHQLTNREHQVMLLLAAGYSVAQIARQLNLSLKTVSTHRKNLLARMGLATNAELLRYVEAHGLRAPVQE